MEGGLGIILPLNTLLDGGGYYIMKSPFYSKAHTLFSVLRWNTFPVILTSEFSSVT